MRSCLIRDWEVKLASFKMKKIKKLLILRNRKFLSSKIKRIGLINSYPQPRLRKREIWQQFMKLRWPKSLEVERLKLWKAKIKEGKFSLRRDPLNRWEKLSTSEEIFTHKIAEGIQGMNLSNLLKTLITTEVPPKIKVIIRIMSIINRVTKDLSPKLFRKRK